MISTTHKKLKDSRSYDHLIPKADLREVTVKKGAVLADTVKFIPQVVKNTRWQTEQLSQYLKGRSIYETCQNVWDFVYDHYAYKKDEDGFEQIRSPRRLHHDKYGDCDCYSTFISTVMTNLGIQHAMRLTKYSTPEFQHVYIVALDEFNRPIVLDCVADQFNYEVPYKEKKDIPMDLQFLDGIEGYNDDFGMHSIDEIEGIGFNPKNLINKVTRTIKKAPEAIKQTVHTVNRINPATVALRNGLLAAMKLNIMNVGGRIKWAYLSDAEAQSRGVDMVKFGKLKKVREKLEQIFFGAGGNPESLRTAVLTGRGNKNNAVQGFKNVGLRSSLQEILGEDLFYAENIQDMEEFSGVGSLGEPITAVAVVGTATTAISALAALLHSIGNIFPKRQAGSEDFEQGNGGENTTNLPATENSSSYDNSTNESLLPTNTSEASASNQDPGSGSSAPDDSADMSYWERNKNWLKPSLIGVSVLSALGLAYLATRPKKKAKSSGKPLNGLEDEESLAGTSNSAKKRGLKKSKKTKQSGAKGRMKKAPVALV